MPASRFAFPGPNLERHQREEGALEWARCPHPTENRLAGPRNESSPLSAALGPTGPTSPGLALLPLRPSILMPPLTFGNREVPFGLLMSRLPKVALTSNG